LNALSTNAIAHQYLQQARRYGGIEAPSVPHIDGSLVKAMPFLSTTPAGAATTSSPLLNKALRSHLLGHAAATTATAPSTKLSGGIPMSHRVASKLGLPPPPKPFISPPHRAPPTLNTAAATSMVASKLTVNHANANANVMHAATNIAADSTDPSDMYYSRMLDKSLHM
jgi:hypothetical protein